jgi:hypothetical protein
MFFENELLWPQFVKLNNIKNLSINEQVQSYNKYLENLSLQRKLYEMGAAAGNYTTATQEPVVPPVYAIGDAALGGIIFYILEPGDPGYVEGEQHGFVSSAADLSTSAPWGCLSTDIIGADEFILGSGYQNTIDILSQCLEAGIAARLCSDLVEGGYSDWYLPSEDESNKLFINRIVVGGFDTGYYWTSTEGSPGFNQAAVRNFDDGEVFYLLKDDVTTSTRAIRSF